LGVTAIDGAWTYEQGDKPVITEGGYPRISADVRAGPDSEKAFHRGRRLVKHQLTEGPQIMSTAPTA